MKKFSVRLEAEVYDDIQEAVLWYEDSSVGLGKKFLLENEEYLEHLSRHPYFKLRYKDLRVVLLSRFPFQIHYRVDEAAQEVIILAVINTHRNPSIWPGAEK